MTNKLNKKLPWVWLFFLFLVDFARYICYYQLVYWETLKPVWAEGSVTHGDLVCENTKINKRVLGGKKKNPHQFYSFVWAWKKDKQDCHWFEHPIWPRAEMGVRPCSFAQAQIFDCPPTLICTKSLDASSCRSCLHRVLDTAKSIPKVDRLGLHAWKALAAITGKMTNPLFSCGEHRDAHLHPQLSNFHPVLNRSEDQPWA